MLAAVAVALLSALFIARHAIILIYISLLIAIGFGPVVRAIEHQHLVPVGTKRLPRWLAILVVYFVIIGALVGIAALVIPPLIDQAQELWRDLPVQFNRAQTYLIRWGLMTRPITLEEAVQSSSAARCWASSACARDSYCGDPAGRLPGSRQRPRLVTLTARRVREWRSTCNR